MRKVGTRQALWKLGAAALCAVHTAPAVAQSQAGQLSAGAARVDITPAASELPPSSQGVLDPLYARAIVVDNGQTRAAQHGQFPRLAPVAALDASEVQRGITHGAAPPRGRAARRANSG